jgi:hypothetical protein
MASVPGKVMGFGYGEHDDFPDVSRNQIWSKADQDPNHNIHLYDPPAQPAYSGLLFPRCGIGYEDTVWVPMRGFDNKGLDVFTFNLDQRLWRKNPWDDDRRVSLIFPIRR